MKIIVRKADNVVLHEGEDLILDTYVHGDGWRAIHLTPNEVDLLDAPFIPDDFVEGGWTYLKGVWTENNKGAEHKLGKLALLKQQKISNLSLSFESEVYSDIVHDNKTWKTDATSRTLLAEVLAVGSVPPGMYWRDSDDVQHSMTYADLQGLAYAILERGLTADANLIAKIKAASDATSVGDVESVIY